jgi:hypothetical protein
MIFRYQSLISFIAYENIQPLAQIKLKYFYSYENIPIAASYQDKVEYFYAGQIYCNDENFDINEYILSLPIISVENLNESKNIFEVCSKRKVGQLENYLRSQALIQEILSSLPTSTTTSTTTVTSTTVTTTPCPTGVLSRVYYINATYICAICVATNEFVCSPYANYNYDNCLNSANSINQGNTNCTTITSTTLAPTSTTPIGPQG